MMILGTAVRRFLAVCVLAAMAAGGVRAFETDQYNLPPVPLADIGDEVSEYVAGNIRQAAERLNTRIAAAEACLAQTEKSRPKGCGRADAERRKLAAARSGEAAAREVYRLLGDGIFPLSHIGSWLKSHKFGGSPARYTAKYGDSIWAILPTNYLTISPTIRMYGVEFGVDKIEHLLQQGYTYYKTYTKETARGAANEAAAKRAVRWGQMSERTFYGFLVSGVFSNADLYSNFAGMKFYIGLTSPVTIGGEVRPATLVLSEGRWKMSDGAAAGLLKPFITEHLNEALNPNGFSFLVYGYVRGVVTKRACPQWKKAFPEYTRDSLERLTASLRLWHGEDYGFTGKKRMISIGERCFDSGR